ncbi:GNAT family N-acetyltransferase [Streptomyces spongiicola]|uniref:GNAT family N-acetyltransferase n=1 Tax=Streptomyces spongiicola TaxID=1690221 RepID=A0A2S1Z7E3_9ACTN|nr:GNAT family N-acetyltransferase [Streptomyces spongiicola]AWK12232.1 GNAT family N-acetyltransferase [Streptomyces spongiicola]GBQ02313.1 GNAT family N-acetyltransferase [Streptomyces spongiicola]
MTGFTVSRLGAGELGRAAPRLAELLVDAVEGGASVGFLAPLDRTAAEEWWNSHGPALAAGGRAVWVARDGERVVGTVSAGFTGYPNSGHRAEIAKLLVHREARGRGLGRALLGAAERGAAGRGATLLVLDTETGSPAERLYRSAGWTAAGVIPGFAADPGGTLRPTTFYYKQLSQDRPG